VLYERAPITTPPARTATTPPRPAPARDAVTSVPPRVVPQPAAPAQAAGTSPGGQVIYDRGSIRPPARQDAGAARGTTPMAAPSAPADNAQSFSIQRPVIVEQPLDAPRTMGGSPVR
jgi:hypothetical protein